MGETQLNEIDIRGILGLLRRQVRLIVSTVVISLGIATISLFVLKPVFTATALILVDPSKKDLLETSRIDVGVSAANARIDSEVEIIKSNSTLLRVIEKNNLIADEEFGNKIDRKTKLLTRFGLTSDALPTGEEALQSVLQRLEEALRVRRRGLTYVISVSFSANSARRAADLTNSVAQAYIENQLNAKIGGALVRRNILSARIAEASEAIASTELALGNYVFANIDRISSQTGSAQFSELTTRLGGLEREQLALERLSVLIDQGVRNQNWSTLAQSLGLEAIAELERQRQETVNKLAQTQVDDAASIDLKAELADIENQITQKARSELTRLSGSARELQAQSVNLKSQIRVSAIASDLPADMMAEIYELQQNAGVARNQYQALLSRLREVETQVDLQVADSRVFSRALPPTLPSFPNKKLILALAGMIGLGLGIGFAFLTENFIGGFTAVAQIESVLKLPVLATIPKLKAGTLPEGVNPSATVLHAPLSSFSENIRRARAGIDQVMRHQRGDGQSNKAHRGIVVMVSSAVPGEGKTTTALALARTYALTGQRTLLIDADMRQPTIHRELGIAIGEIGLFEVISQPSSKISLKSVAVVDKETGLHVLVGKASNVPTDQLFVSKRFANLIDGAADHFDIVILDTPPAGPVVDAHYLAQYVDYLAFIIRWASTPQSEVRSTLSQLQKALPDDAQIGIILTQQDKKMTGYFSSYERYYEEGSGSPSI